MCAPARACLRACMCVFPARACLRAPTRACVPANMCASAPVRKRVLARLRVSEGLTVHSCLRVCACKCASARFYPYVLAHVHAFTQTNMRVCARIRKRACMCARVYANERACMPLRACSYYYTIKDIILIPNFYLIFTWENLWL